MNNNSIENQIKKVVEKVDSAHIEHPELMYFVDLVSDEQLKIAKKQNKQLSIFCTLGVGIITLLFSLYAFFFSAFIIMQAISVVAPIIVFIVMKLLAREANYNDAA